MRRFLSFVKASTVGLAFAGSGHARRRISWFQVPTSETKQSGVVG